MKVAVYFNLHRKLFSVKALEGPDKGKVIQHRSIIILRDVEFKVSEAGRQRVLRERKKNVHAYVIGHLLDDEAREDYVNAVGYETAVRYNPYTGSTFVTPLLRPVERASYACCMVDTANRASVHAVHPIYG